jgi:two-component system response regulator YesN
VGAPPTTDEKPDQPDIHAYGSKQPFAYPAPVILAVDDSPEMRGLLRTVLGPSYSVLVACNGLEAIERLEQVQVDLILTDLTMPEMDGLELADFVLRHYPRTRLAFVSSCVEDDILKEAALRSPYTLAKPFTLPALRETLKQIMESERA